MSFPQQTPPRKKFAPHKTLNEGWTYISIPNDNVVIGVRMSVTKVMRLEDSTGQPLKDPNNNPLYEFQSATVARTLTTEEYKVLQKTTEGEV
jgi:hypothetical protein